MALRAVAAMSTPVSMPMPVIARLHAPVAVLAVTTPVPVVANTWPLTLGGYAR